MQDAPTLFSKLQPNIPTSTASFPEGPTWIKNKIPGLDNRTHHALILVDHLMIIISKPDSTQIVQSFTPKPSPCFAIDLKKNVWRNVIVQGVPYQREGHTICAYKENEFLMYGGQTPESQTFFGKTPAGISSELCVLKLLNKNELILECKLKYENDPARPSQIAKASSGPARAYHTANIYNGRMYIFGGIEKIDSTTATNSVHFVNIETGIWESPQVQGDIPEPRSGHCSVLYKDQIYIFGGINQPSPNKDIFVFNIANNSWRKVESKGVSPQLKAHGVAHQINGKAYFFGAQNALSVGEGDGLFTLDLDPDSFTWNAVKTQGVVEYPRIGHKSVIYNGGLVIFGGNSGDPSVYSIALPENILSSTSVQGGIAKTQKPADTSKGQASIFVQDLGKMFMDSTFSDVTFTVKGQSIPAHKNILAMRCPHFVSMFSSSEGTQLSKVEITDVDPKTFKAVIEFAYCNQVELDVDLALDVLKLSHKYKFSSLKQICSEYLSGKLSIENYVAIASASEEYQAPVLEDAVLEFVTKNLRSIEQKREYPNLSKEIFWKIILKLGKK